MEQRVGLAVVGHYVGSFGIGGRPSRHCCSLNHDLLLNHICPHDDDDDDGGDERICENDDDDEKIRENDNDGEL